MTLFSIILIALLLQSGEIYGFSVPGKPKGGKHYLKIKSPDDLKAMFRYTGDSVCFISSHRGGPENHLCENSIATFENTLKHTYSMMRSIPTGQRTVFWSHARSYTSAYIDRERPYLILH
jgi:glycerophosphoryl diester phosphodiesterase